MDYDVVCLSHLRWDFVWQRPQHLLGRCARERRVFFVEEPTFDAREPWLETRLLEDRLAVAVPHLPAGASDEERERALEQLVRRLLEAHAVEDYVLWYYTPMALGFTRALTPLAVVYDCMDDLASFAGAPKGLRRREEQLLGGADLVFTGGPSLYEAKCRRHAHVHLFPSSVDVAHFARAREPHPDPSDQRDIPRPRLGFFGVIDERMDIELLARLADARPDWHIVLLGPVVKIDPESLPRRANLHYLGQKEYGELPLYMAGWDVAILPFARNEATRSISPTKVPEYLAGGLPVVTTSIRDVVRSYAEHGLVRVADSSDEFARACAAAMDDDASARLRSVDAFLTESSWDFTWADMRELVDRAVRIRRRPARRPALNGRPAAFDWLVLGAGFAGSVMAERLASQLGQRVLVVDRRNHVAGNAYDHHDAAGVLVHRYGPHIFHTNSSEVWQYLSQFTDWRPYEHRVLASVDGQLVPFPINLDTVNQLYGVKLSTFELEAFFESAAEPRSPIRTSEDLVLSKVGKDLYLKFFRNYTRKQWGLDPSELDASVTARVPTRNTRDSRYFTDTYQAMPLHGYTRMFERILSHANIKVLLNADYRELGSAVPYERMVYTGPIDEFFDFRFGRLPYRSLDFRFETLDVPVFQPAAVINYPNEFPYTRVTEFKYLTGQEHAKTSVVYEYPRSEGDPYYPVPRPENGELYGEYKQLADATADTIFLGRLATYKYYNMDQVVAQALAVFRRLADGTTTEDDGDRSFPPSRALGRSRVHGQSRRR
jgi:UDP-galactopyranose mutase